MFKMDIDNIASFLCNSLLRLRKLLRNQWKNVSNKENQPDTILLLESNTCKDQQSIPYTQKAFIDKTKGKKKRIVKPICDI